MSNEKPFDPLMGYKLLSEMWEKQLTGLLFKLTDNKEFVRSTGMGLDLHSRYMERLRKNQELIAALMNIPTKKDVANAAKQSIQAEEKIDSLEELIWNVQDGLAELSKENLTFLQQVVDTVNQMKAELQQTRAELVETKKIGADIHELQQGMVELKIMQVNLQEVKKELIGIKAIQAELKETVNLPEREDADFAVEELKHEFGQLAEIKQEIAALRELLGKEKGKKPNKNQEKELVLPGTGTSK